MAVLRGLILIGLALRCIQSLRLEKPMGAKGANAETSYEEHKEHIRKKAEQYKSINSAEKLKAFLGTDDQKRHKVLLSGVDAFIEHGDKWLTVGDLQFGRDAYYLSQKGANVIASDLDTTFLVKAQSFGLLKNISAQNVEHLTFKDDTFDYVLCKEAFHHFPRPWLGLYEMLRVAKKGVVLIEPYDTHWNVYNASKKPDPLKSFGLAGDVSDHYESVGNYQFRPNPREMEKTAWAMGLPQVVLRGEADHFPNKNFAEFMNATSKEIAKARAGNTSWHFGTIALIKSALSAEVKANMEKEGGYVIRTRPVNPYVTDVE